MPCRRAASCASRWPATTRRRAAAFRKPYGPDKEAYNQELTGRQQRGELAAADTAQFATGPRFRTDHGRVVYDGGGIMPDVFVPRDTLAHSAYYGRLQRLGALQAYALAFYQQHKGELSGLRFAQYQAVFRITDTELDGLLRLAAQAGLRPDPAALRRCAPALRGTLKADIARPRLRPRSRPRRAARRRCRAARGPARGAGQHCFAGAAG